MRHFPHRTVQLFAKPAKAINGGKGSEVVKLKQQLLDVTQSTRRGIATSDEQREEIDGLIAALEPREYLLVVVKGYLHSEAWLAYYMLLSVMLNVRPIC